MEPTHAYAQCGMWRDAAPTPIPYEVNGQLEANHSCKSTGSNNGGPHGVQTQMLPVSINIALPLATIATPWVAMLRIQFDDRYKWHVFSEVTTTTTLYLSMGPSRRLCKMGTIEGYHNYQIAQQGRKLRAIYSR
jgi:hypothetical protein